MHTFKAKIISLILMTALIVSSLAPLSVFAESSSTFTTSITTYGVDQTSPSQPTNLVATAVSSSQIDLTWTASTDNFAVTGYKIFRDSVFQTNIVGTTYSDLGLNPVTTYSYTVQAFDAATNLSLQSDPASATTLTAPVTSPSSGGSGSIRPLIYNVNVQSGLHQATLSFTTNVSTQSKIFWGKTHEYETGSLMVLFYGTQHELDVKSLDSGTIYYLRIEATDYRGVSVSAETSFTTKSPVTVFPLSNPSNFKASPLADSIKLSWVNPSDPRFDTVHIVRSEKFFPKDPFDGLPIYDGKDTTFSDTNVVVGKTYYYTIFAKGLDGLYSSGALAEARIAKTGEIIPPSEDPFAHIPQAGNVDPIILGLKFSDFDFIQQGRLLVNIGNDLVAINGGVDLTIRLKYEKVPELLKTIAFTLIDPEDSTKVFPFLLRVNTDKTYYEATIGALGRSGNYTVSIVVLDYQNQGLKKIQGNLRALVFAIPMDIRRGFDPSGFLILLLIILVIIILLSTKRRRDDRKLRKKFNTYILPRHVDYKKRQ